MMIEIRPRQGRIQDFLSRGRQPMGGGQHTNLPDFPKNYMILRKFWSVGGGAARRQRPPG